MRQLRGTPASSGVGRGALVLLAPETPAAGGRIEAGRADAEIERLAACVSSAADSLDALALDVAAAGHADEAGIFSAQAAMARDPALAAAAETRIRAGHDAIGAIEAAGAELADQLRGLGDELLSARAADVEDVVDRIAGLLAGRSGRRPTLDRPAVVVAADLSPSLAASLPRDRLLGFALEAGSPTSHAAILARAYGIPAVVGVPGLLAAVEAGKGRNPEGSPTIAIDGDSGEVVIDPDEATARRFAGRMAEAARASERALAEADLPVVTVDGTAVSLLANIGTPGESERAIALGARGVGLFRTEYLFLERSAPPSEDEQTEAYRSVVEAFRPHPVTIRLLDVGGDKPIPYLPIAREANPFLGVRAVRLAPERPELFVTQLRATMRAAAVKGGPAGSVRVMAPMIADASDVDVLESLAARARSSLEREGIAHGEVALGVMLEIPSAVLVGDSYFGRLAFASLGTNDLLQYTLAVDRGNRELARYQDWLHPALLRLIAAAVQASARAGIDLSVCGEMAGDPVASLALVGLGIRQLSMATSSLAPVRRAIRACRLDVLERTAVGALDLPSAAAVRERFARLLGSA